LTERSASDGAEIEVKLSSPSRWEARVQLDNGRTVPFLAHRDGQQVHVWLAGESYVFSPPTPTARARRSGQQASDDIISPVPGVVITVHVAADDTVTAGQDLVIVESMKTEQIVKSPRDGVVERVSVEEGDRVDKGMRLVVLVPEVGEQGGG
jgi:3-methylcrotonyl-CoA carboxylase alpha subunit